MSTVVHIDRPTGGIHCGRRVSERLRRIGEEEYDSALAQNLRLCAHCVGGFQHSLSTRGFLFVARFAPREYPEVIWFQDEPLVGPFCVHCGNPWYVHGPGRRCRSGRIHPLLPLGDLPRAGATL